MTECPYCAEINNVYEGNIFYSFTGKRNYIMRETQHFVVLPSLGMFIEGFLLMVPKEHYLSLGALPENLFVELYELKEFVIKLYHDIYNKPPIFFEHGSTSCMRRGGACVEHAHLQSVPLKKDLKPELIRLLGSPLEINKYEDLRNLYAKDQPYIFYERFDGKMFVWEVSILPSQFFRQVLAKEIGKTEKWNWQSYIGKDEIIRFISKYEKWKDQNDC